MATAKSMYGYAKTVKRAARQYKDKKVQESFKKDAKKIAREANKLGHKEQTEKTKKAIQKATTKKKK